MENLKLHNPSIKSILRILSSIPHEGLSSVIALSILYVKHPDKDNNQQCSIKVIIKKKKIPIHVKLAVT